MNERRHRRVLQPREAGNGGMRTKIILSALSLGACAAIAGAAHGQRPALHMLDELQDGNWEMRERGGGVHNLCVEGGHGLIQLRHPGMACRRVVIEDKADQVTVQYTCRGNGYGRTQVRRETNRLIQIDSQGISRGVPFAFSAEARQTGNCRS
ncbi:hypothetical protein [Novosphingobium panipatense]|nr:hypothetical protein [Novosphingobium panipatense]